MRRLTLLAGGAALAVLVPAALVLAARHPEESLALQASTAGVLVAAALVGRPQRAAPLLLATALAVTAQSLPLPHAGGALLFTLALVLGGAAASLAGLSSV